MVKGGEGRREVKGDIGRLGKGVSVHEALLTVTGSDWN